jgi:hypothetical protein
MHDAADQRFEPCNVSAGSRLIAWGLVLLGAATPAGAVLGVPLYGDGAFCFVELLMGLCLRWPFVLLATVRQDARAILVYGSVLALLLPFLHPIAFALCWRRCVLRRIER